MPRLPFPQSFSMTLPLNHWNTHTHPSFGTTSSQTEHLYCHPRHTSLLFYYSHNNSFSTTHIIISPLSLPHPPQHPLYRHSFSTTHITIPSLTQLNFSSLLYTQHIPLYHTQHNITPTFHLTFSPTLTTLLVYFYYIRFPSILFPPSLPFSLPFSPSHPLLFSFLFSRSRPYDRLLSFILW